MSDSDLLELDFDARRFFLNQFREARLTAQKNAEAFDEIIHVIERLGAYRISAIQSLGPYKNAIIDLALRSAFSDGFSREQRAFHTRIDALYDLVKDARNSALHQGARARHLTEHAIELALVLEDALVNAEPVLKTVSDIMILSPVTADLWQPVSIVRQHMLINSFSYIPILLEDGGWHLISDHAVVSYLLGAGKNERKRRLAISIGEASNNGLNLVRAECVGESLDKDSLTQLKDSPVLVFAEDSEGNPNEDRLVGIVAAFDVL